MSSDMIESPLNLNFRILTLCGIWRPHQWSSGCRYWFYNTYTVIVILLVVAMPLTHLIQLCLPGPHDNFVESVYMMMTMTAQYGKIFTMLNYRHRIIELLKSLETGTCKATNSHEQTVQQHVYKSIRFRTKAYCTLITITTIATTMSLCASNIPKRTLPYKLWLPFDIGRDIVYSLLFAGEYVSLFLAAVISCGYDTFAPGILLQASAQFGLLECRIKTVSTTFAESGVHDRLESLNMEQKRAVKRRMGNCVQHHLLIHQLIHGANDILTPAILLTHITTTTVLCTNVYIMSGIKGFNARFISVMVYSCAVLLKLFMLCYAGSELTEKSQSMNRAIYDTEWYTLDGSNKKTALIMMTRGTKAVILANAKIFQVSVDFFVKVVQFSYSAYSVLKQVSGSYEH